MCWRLFILVITILDVFYGAESACIPAPFNVSMYRSYTCQTNQPLALAGDSLGIQFLTTLADCGLENKYETYPVNLGPIANIQIGDEYEYELYWDQPDTQCVLDLFYVNASNVGKALRYDENPVPDQNGVSNHPLDMNLVDLGYAYRKWYRRSFILPPDFPGSLATVIEVVCNSLTPGTKMGYFRRVNIKAADGTVKHPIYDPQTTPEECIGEFENCLGCQGACRVYDECNCADQTSYDTCFYSQTCSAPISSSSCSCIDGFTGSLCDQPVCSSCSSGFICVAPETCECDTTVVGSCSETATCQPPKPADDALCRVVDGIPQWVVNSTLTVNDTTSFYESVVIVGDFIVSSGTEVQLSSGSTITVLGCPQINGSLALELTQEEIDELNENGSLNRTALVYDVTCSEGAEFNQVVIKNSQECIRYEATQNKYPGTITILVQVTTLSCENLQPDGTTNVLPDWAIAVIVVGGLLIAGGAIGLGVALRQKQLRDEMGNLDRKQSN